MDPTQKKKREREREKHAAHTEFNGADCKRAGEDSKIIGKCGWHEILPDKMTIWENTGFIVSLWRKADCKVKKLINKRWTLATTTTKNTWKKML